MKYGEWQMWTDPLREFLGKMTGDIETASSAEHTFAGELQRFLHAGRLSAPDPLQTIRSVLSRILQESTRPELEEALEARLTTYGVALSHVRRALQAAEEATRLRAQIVLQQDVMCSELRHAADLFRGLRNWHERRKDAEQ